MIRVNLPPFQNVSANGIATVEIPRWNLAINRLTLVLGGTTFTKAMISDIKIKLGARIVYQITGSRLDTINQYKGINVDATHLTLDFTERDAPDIVAKEIATYDLGVITDKVFIEVTIAGATAPTLAGFAMLTPTSRNPQQPNSGNPYIMKLTQAVVSLNGAAKWPVSAFQPKGALVKRLHLFHTFVTQVEVKKSGIIVFEGLVTDLQFMETEYRKVAQAGHFAVDFVVDNNQSGMLKTADASSLELNVWTSAADTVTLVQELVDLPYNV